MKCKCETVARCMRGVVPVPYIRAVVKACVTYIDCVTYKRYFLSQKGFSCSLVACHPGSCLVCRAGFRDFGLHASTAAAGSSAPAHTANWYTILGRFLDVVNDSHACTLSQQACLSPAYSFGRAPKYKQHTCPCTCLWAAGALCRASVVCAQLSGVWGRVVCEECAMLCCARTCCVGYCVDRL